MKFIPALLFILLIFSCKEPATQVDAKAHVQESFQEPLQSPLNLDLVKQQITAFYVQKYLEKSEEYLVRELKIQKVRPVRHFYVDSIKSELYQNGIEKIKVNLQVRQNMIDKLNNRIKRYEARGDFEKANELRKTVDSYTFRSDKQKDEILALEQKDEKVRNRMEKGLRDTLQYYQVDFYIKDQVDYIVREDSSSFIFNQKHQIEDLLEDKAWEN